MTKLADLSTTVNDLSQGFLNISMSEELKTKVNEDNQQEHEDEERALRVLMDAFHSSSKLGKEIFTVDSLSVAPFLASLPGVPKSFALFISRHDPTTVRATFQNVPRGIAIWPRPSWQRKKAAEGV